MLFAGAVLAFSLFTGCKQGNGDRCEVARDCESNFCMRCPGGDFQNMTCSDPANPICPTTTTGTGGSTGAGGATGTGGATGDSGIDTAPDAPSTGADAGDDGSTD